MMFESRFEGIEKMTKKQNKEQVPPLAETESKKPASNKPAKKASNSNTVSHPTYKNLEEAFKAVSQSNKNVNISKQMCFGDLILFGQLFKIRTKPKVASLTNNFLSLKKALVQFMHKRKCMVLNDCELSVSTPAIDCITAGGLTLS